MKSFRNAFVTGILVLVPLLLTIDILSWFVNAVENSVRRFMPTGALPYDFRGLAFLLAIGVILAVGFLTQNFIGKSLVRWLDHLIRHIPLGGGIYTAIKKFLVTVFNPSSDKFKEVVLVPFPREGMYSVGFRTGSPDPKVARKLKSKNLANVFVPCTPNPTSGFYLIVPEDQLIPLDLPVPEAFKIVISMGLVTSEEEGRA